MTLPLILITEGCDARPLAWLNERARVVEVSLEQADWRTHLAQADGLMVRTYTRVDAALLERAPRLRVVGRGGVGLENIDIPACRARGVQVVYTPDANTRAVADYCIGYMLQLLRPWCLFNPHAYPPAEFKRIRNTVRGRQLDELTLGIWGMGRVGRRLGKIAADGFGMRVIYHDIQDVSAAVNFPAVSVDVSTLLAEADVLSLHVDMRPENRNLVGAGQLAAMKPNAILLNTSRGEVVDAQALAAALRANRLAGAALDVFSPEPPDDDFPLLGLEKVLLTPHLAARTHTALENMSWVVRDILAVLNGQPPRHPAP